MVFRNSSQPIHHGAIDELVQPLEATVIGWGAPFVSITAGLFDGDIFDNCEQIDSQEDHHLLDFFGALSITFTLIAVGTTLANISRIR